MIHPMQLAEVPIDRLTPYPGNARRGDHQALADSLRAHGQYRPLVVQRSTHHVLAGNNTLIVARELGYTRIAVQYLDVDDDTARRILLADNRTNDGASYDEQALTELLHGLDEVTGTGFTDAEIDQLLDTEPLTDILFTDPPPAPAEHTPPQSRPTAPPKAKEPAPTAEADPTRPDTPTPVSAPPRETPRPRSGPSPTPTDITLSYDPDTYRWVVAQLDHLTHTHGHHDHADTVAHLLAPTATTTRPV